MSEILEKRERNVIPLWRSFRDASLLNAQELQSLAPTTTQTPVLSSAPLDDAASAFARTESAWTAASLIEAALVMGDSDVAEEAAAYILELPCVSSPARVLAGRYLDRVSDASGENRVKESRRELAENVRDPIAWADLSYGLTVTGKFQAARRAMQTALSLAPANRFVLRAAARFFAHANDYEQGLSILRHCDRTAHDPWLAAAEIGLAHSAKVHPRFLRQGRELLSGHLKPRHTTELASAIGTFDFLDDNLRAKGAAKRLLERSLIDSNENSTAQFTWLRTVKHLDMSVPRQELRRGYEAQALDDMSLGDVPALLDHAEQWFYSEPYTQRSADIFSWAATSLAVGQTARAIKVSKIATRANPDSALLWNNLAFAYLLEGHVLEAGLALRRGSAAKETSRIDRLCLTATEGMYLYRTGHADAGRSNYLRTIEIAKGEDLDPRLVLSAYANLSREEAMVGSEMARTYLLSALEQMKLCRGYPDVKPLLLTTIQRIATIDPTVGDRQTIGIAQAALQEYDRQSKPKRQLTSLKCL